MSSISDRSPTLKSVSEQPEKESGRVKIHLYTNLSGLRLYRAGQDFLAWNENSNDRPVNADVHIEVHESDVIEARESGVFHVRGKGK